MINFNSRHNLRHSIPPWKEKDGIIEEEEQYAQRKKKKSVKLKKDPNFRLRTEQSGFSVGLEGAKLETDVRGEVAETGSQ